jgi:hypothetical protein
MAGGRNSLKKVSSNFSKPIRETCKVSMGTSRNTRALMKSSELRLRDGEPLMMFKRRT